MRPITTMNTLPYALISAWDKTRVIPCAQRLTQMGIPILSTGGTAQALRAAGIEVTSISDHTQHPEILDGRVKTLHPRIHAGLLARVGHDDALLSDQNIPLINWVIVHLYPFQQVTSDPQCTPLQAIEHIDIGGTCLIRAAAKNHERVTVLVDPDDYDAVLTEMESDHRHTSIKTRRTLAQKAFAHTARYDHAIAAYFQAPEDLFPEHYQLTVQKKQDLRYGENPHQKGAFYANPCPEPGSMANLVQHQGKPLSYNNIADVDAALNCVKPFKGQAACAIIKHANPCGVAIGDTPKTAYKKAFDCDPLSAYGGIIAFNQPLTQETASSIIASQFVEAIVAPSVDAGALSVCAQKKNIRVLSTGPLDAPQSRTAMDIRSVSGGVLIQESDRHQVQKSDLKCVTMRTPNDAMYADLLFAWNVVKHCKSNAIVLAQHGTTLGIGAGQSSRIHCLTLAMCKSMEAGSSLEGCVMASDAFFPFTDVVEMAQSLGVQAIIHPGGSIRDHEIIAKANALGLIMVTTGIRHFYH